MNTQIKTSNERKQEQTYTVNTQGRNIDTATTYGYHAYYASGITAVEIPAQNKQDARIKAEQIGLKVLYVFL